MNVILAAVLLVGQTPAEHKLQGRVETLEEVYKLILKNEISTRRSRLEAEFKKQEAERTKLIHALIAKRKAELKKKGGDGKQTTEDLIKLLDQMKAQYEKRLKAQQEILKDLQIELVKDIPAKEGDSLVGKVEKMLIEATVQLEKKKIERAKAKQREKEAK